MSPLPTARDVLVERATRDVDDTIQHLRERLREESKGWLRALETVVFSLITLINPRGRIARDIDHLMTVAKRVEAGEDARTVAHEMLHDTLRLWELNLVIRIKDPLFQHALEVSERLYAERLPDFARMAAIENPLDYADLVRRAFPDRAYVDAIVHTNGEEVLRILTLARANPQLIRIPKSWMPKLLDIGEDMVKWKIHEVHRELDDIYKTTTPQP